MKLVIGTDEAGYGPNIGPLAIAATAWPVDDGAEDLFQDFQSCFCRPDQTPNGRLWVGDSKQLHKSSSGPGSLEKSVLPLCFRDSDRLASGQTSWSDLLTCVQCGANRVSKASPGLPWYEDFDPQLPQHLTETEVKTKLELVDQFLSSVQPTEDFRPMQRATLIEAEQFNAQSDRLGNKATLLSYSTLQLVRDIMAEVAKSTNPPSQIEVYCDKHGGRSGYAGILQDLFDESWVQELERMPRLSRYQLSYRGIPVSFTFLAKGESQFPIAYASMIAKYLREISVMAFNQYWESRIEGYQPTAGYPVDAKRVRKQIEPAINKLGLRETHWWRLR